MLLNKTAVLYFSSSGTTLKLIFLFQMHHGKSFCTEYEKSKFLADGIALKAAESGVPIVILYPGVIYGPGKLTAGNVLARIVSISSLCICSI